MSDNRVTIIASLDFSKAFDSVHWKLLITKMRIFGIPSGQIAWLSSYLSDRSQALKVNKHTKTDYMQLKCGVPQGSILGPILFNIYVSDLPDYILPVRCQQYADDVLCYTPAKTVDDVFTMVDAIKRSKDHARQNNLKLNDKKTQTMIISSRNNILSKELKLKINAEFSTIFGTPATSITSLGVVIDENLSWSEQIQSIRSKGKRAIGSLYKQRSLLPTALKVTLMNSLVLSHVDYCLIVYAKNLKRGPERLLERLMASAMKFVLGSKADERRILDAYITYKWLTVAHRQQFKLGVLAFKAHCNLSIDYIAEAWNAIIHAQNYNVHTRQATNMQLQHGRTTPAQDKLIINRMIDTWNDIPFIIKTVNNIKLFQIHYKLYLGSLQVQAPTT